MGGPVFLFPLDGSAEAEAALRLAARTIQPIPGVVVRLLVVIDERFADLPDEVREGMAVGPETEVFREHHETDTLLARARDICGGAGLDCQVHVRRGRPYEAIIEETRIADVLVMHRLRASHLADRLRGSMTERLARNAHCHVLLMDTTTGRGGGPDEAAVRPRDAEPHA